MLDVLFTPFKPAFSTGKVAALGLLFRPVTNFNKMRILNVAEKNDAAKHIAEFLSNGRTIKRESLSKYNKIYEFESYVFNQNCQMIMTSVSGHLMNFDFVGPYRKWGASKPIDLFEAPIKKFCTEGNENILRSLQEEVNSCPALIIWTDCDREGECIGFEIINVCKEVKPNLRIYRAKFSEITKSSVETALKNLEEPNKYLNDAVNVRMELDLRIGAAFTRFQCHTLRKAFPVALKDNLVSYGSCQFPTLGFVTDRFKAIANFIPEPFWKINVKHIINDLAVGFEWERVRLFDKLAVEVLLNKCLENKVARIESVEKKPKTKWRPRPLDTVDLEKIASTKLKINAKETLKIAEKLYTQGLISYPRTETNIFPKNLNLCPLVQIQTCDEDWGEFARKVLEAGPNPFQGKKSDQAHPPIHPIKYTNSLTGNHKKIYELIVRHFLACLSKHAEGLETVVKIDIAEEKFLAKGLIITAKNYLQVYKYEKWSDKEIHDYREGDTFIPEISMDEGETKAPDLLTEADLIALMEKHGIGTDATHAEHIETIKSRLYVGLQNEKYFVPRTLGMGLVEGYTSMGHEMAKPELRANLEADLKSICEAKKSPEEVLSKHLGIYKTIFENVQGNVGVLTETIQTYIQVEAEPIDTAEPIFRNEYPAVSKCRSCGSPMLLRTKKNNLKYIGCSNYPSCRNAIWFPPFVKDAEATKDPCEKCGPDTYIIKFKFDGSCYLPSTYHGCIGGCDANLLHVLNSNSKISPKHANDQSKARPNASNLITSLVNNDYNSLPKSNLRRAHSSKRNYRLCHCEVKAIQLTVKKPGPNCGRIFYKCGAPNGSKKCEFFEWDDEESKNLRDGKSDKTQISDIAEDTRCYCAIPCRKLVVSKEGPNKGREFFSCGKFARDGEMCNFFAWVK